MQTHLVRALDENVFVIGAAMLVALGLIGLIVGATSAILYVWKGDKRERHRPHRRNRTGRRR